MTKEQTFECIATDINELEDCEKKFALWLLLKEYESEIKIPEHPETIEEYREMIFNRDNKIAINHVIELLGYELF